MSDTFAGLLQIGLLLAALAACYRPLGAYMARVYSSERDLGVERLVYRLIGVDPRADQRWPVYARSLLAFSLVGVLGLYALQRLQPQLPLSLGFPGVAPDQAFNTAASFVTNTNWQSYSGESTMGHLIQMSGLAVQNFVSAAVGMAVAVALIRGFVRARTDRLGNFWVDLVRGSLRILLPIAVAGTVVLIALGAVQNLSSGTEATTLSGIQQTITGGPVASQEAIKDLGTNGGGFYNANSSHPFENPNAFSNSQWAASRASARNRSADTAGSYQDCPVRSTRTSVWEASPARQGYCRRSCSARTALVGSAWTTATRWMVPSS